MRGNLFYRGLVLLRPVFIGDTLRTSTEVVALKQNRPRDDGTATGLVVLRISTENQRGEPVLDFWRCAMIPLRDPDAQTGHADSFDAIPAELDMAAVAAAAPRGWRLDLFREHARGEHFADIRRGHGLRDRGPGLGDRRARAGSADAEHRERPPTPGASAHGRRLVYGGHTIAVAAAQAARALPNLVTMVAWRSCDHTGPGVRGRRPGHRS